MKKLLLLILILSVTLSSCSAIENLSKTESEKINEYLNSLLVALEADDKNSVRELFSKVVIDRQENFEQDLEDLLKYFEGEADEYTEDVSCQTSGALGGGEKKVLIKAFYDIKTTKYTYYISLEVCTCDEAEPDNKGITCLNVIKKENILNKSEGMYNYAVDGIDRTSLKEGISVDVNGYYRKIPNSSYDTSKIADIYLNNILGAIENDDEFYVRYWFSHINPFEFFNSTEKSMALLEYFDGTCEPYKGETTVDIEIETIELPMDDPDYKEGGYTRKIGTVSYDIITLRNEIYRFTMRICFDDELDKKNRGIISLYVLKADESTDFNLPYCGDGLFAPGINIGVENLIK